MQTAILISNALILAAIVVGGFYLKHVIGREIAAKNATIETLRADVEHHRSRSAASLGFASFAPFRAGFAGLHARCRLALNYARTFSFVPYGASPRISSSSSPDSRTRPVWRSCITRMSPFSPSATNSGRGILNLFAASYKPSTILLSFNLSSGTRDPFSLGACNAGGSSLGQAMRRYFLPLSI